MSLKQQFATEATERVWWLNSHPPRFNLNLHEDDDDDNNSQPPLLDDDASQSTTTSSNEMEAMFEKPLTPSDVGKLNRLVIPKQHAEKYFPLGGGDSAESKGLLLSFEDESGKCWRFRYSYWNSSQSYVLTKGWSRYVKEKRLDAGDVVLFHRHRLHAHRFFITWRRRHSAPPAHVSTSATLVYPAHRYPTHHQQPSPYQSHPLHAAKGGGSQQGEMQKTLEGNSSSSSSKVLRLFGVNMECQPENDSQTERSYNYNLNMSSPQGAPTQHLYLHPPYSSSDNPHHHMLSQQPYY